MEVPRTVELEILTEVAHLATLDLELQPMLQRITDALATKFGWELVAVLLLDRAQESVRCEAVTATVPTSIAPGTTRALDQGIVSRLTTSGQPLLLDDAESSDDFFETFPGAPSRACVPLRFRGSTVAILALASADAAAFHDRLPLLTAIADPVAGAIARDQLHEELASVKQELEHRTRALEEANTHLGRAIEKLQHISTQDGMTQLANRRHFDDMLAVEWRRGVRNGASIALLLLDIDHFKLYNDEHGHPAGDEVLRRVADVLQVAVQRAADLVARYGGEEFAVLLPETTQPQAVALAESLRLCVELAGVTVSIGAAAAVPTRDSTASELVKRADAALYRAKREGRNRVIGV